MSNTTTHAVETHAVETHDTDKTHSPDIRRVALQKSCYGDRPELGHRVKLSAELEIVDKDGGCSYYDSRAEGLIGTAIAIGAHWSDQPHGRSGWWVTYKVTVPKSLRGLQLYGEDRAR